MRIGKALKRVTRKDTRHKPYFLSGILLFIVLSLGAFLNEGIAFFNVPYNSEMTHGEFYIIFAVNVLAIILFLCFVLRYFKVKPHYGWMAIFIILFVGNTIATFFFPASTSGITVPLHNPSFSWSYSLTDAFRIRYALSFLIGCIDLYLLFAIGPRLFRSSRSMLWMLYAVVFVTLFSIGWSLVYEFDVYKFYFDITRSASSSVPVAASCYNNRNTYATVLLLGICAISLIHSDNPRFWNYILLFGFYFELFFVISKTGILVSTFFLVLYVFYRFAVNVRYHRLRAGLGLTLFIASFTSIFIIGELQLLSRDTAFMKLYMNFVNAMNTQIGSEFLDYRTEIWINSFNYLFDTSPHMAIFGVGEINALKLLREMWQRYEVDFYYTHNGFVHQIFAGGFLRLGVYLIVLVYYCYIVICNAVKGRRTAVTYLFVALAFLGHGLTETTSLIGTDAKSLALTLLIILPMMVDRYRLTHPHETSLMEEQFDTIGTRYGYEISPARKALICSSIVLPVLLFFLGVVPFMSSTKELWFYQYHNIYLESSLTALLAYTPLSFYLCFLPETKGRAVLMTLNSAVIGSVFAFAFFHDSQIGLVIATSILLVTLIVLFLLTARRWSAKKFGGLFMAILPVYMVSAVFIGINHALIYYLANILPASSYTANVGYMFCEAILYFILVYGLAPVRLFTFPLAHSIVHFDTSLSSWGERRERKVDARFERYIGDDRRVERKNRKRLA